MTEYSNGGYLRPPALTPMLVRLHPDECLLVIDKATKAISCCRAGHPTKTSDCAAR